MSFSSFFNESADLVLQAAEANKDPQHLLVWADAAEDEGFDVEFLQKVRTFVNYVYSRRKDFNVVQKRAVDWTELEPLQEIAEDLGFILRWFSHEWFFYYSKNLKKRDWREVIGVNREYKKAYRFIVNHYRMTIRPRERASWRIANGRGWVFGNHQAPANTPLTEVILGLLPAINDDPVHWQEHKPASMEERVFVLLCTFLS